MRQKLKNRLTLILILLSFLLVSAVSVTIIFALTQQNVTTEVGVEYYPSVLLESFSFLENSDETVTISSFDEKNYEGSLVIPKTYNGKPVTSIRVAAFSGCTGLTSIEIPASVTSIGSSAFSGCGLTSIEIPASVTSIGVGAFSGCTGLTSITIDGENTKYHSAGNCLIETESKMLIQGCNTSVIPTDGSVTSIGNSAFSGCGLTSIEIPACVTSIGNYIFRGCTGLTSVTFEENSQLTSIGNDAFYGCTGLTSIEIPASVTSIGNDAFYGCTGLISVTFEENSQLTSIGDYSFGACGLTNMEIPASVTSIGDYAFSGCTRLTSVTIGSGVTSIGNYAFSICTGLTSITIGSGVTSIGVCAFSTCAGLTSVTFKTRNGWFVATDSNATSGENLSSTDLSDYETAASYLTGKYMKHYWKRA